MTAPSTSGRAPEPVAWRVHDFADGWILFDNYAAARNEANATDAFLQPLYAAAPVPGGGITVTASSNPAAVSAEEMTPALIAANIARDDYWYDDSGKGYRISFGMLAELIADAIRAERSSADRRIEAMREACAKVADEHGSLAGGTEIATAIRALPLLPKRQEP